MFFIIIIINNLFFLKQYPNNTGQLYSYLITLRKRGEKGWNLGMRI